MINLKNKRQFKSLFREILKNLTATKNKKLTLLIAEIS